MFKYGMSIALLLLLSQPFSSLSAYADIYSGVDYTEGYPGFGMGPEPGRIEVNQDGVMFQARAGRQFLIPHARIRRQAYETSSRQNQLGGLAVVAPNPVALAISLGSSAVANILGAGLSRPKSEYLYKIRYEDDNRIMREVTFRVPNERIQQALLDDVSEKNRPENYTVMMQPALPVQPAPSQTLPLPPEPTADSLEDPVPVTTVMEVAKPTLAQPMPLPVMTVRTARQPALPPAMVLPGTPTMENLEVTQPIPVKPSPVEPVLEAVKPAILQPKSTPPKAPENIEQAKLAEPLPAEPVLEAAKPAIIRPKQFKPAKSAKKLAPAKPLPFEALPEAAASTVQAVQPTEPALIRPIPLPVKALQPRLDEQVAKPLAVWKQPVQTLPRIAPAEPVLEAVSGSVETGKSALQNTPLSPEETTMSAP